MVLNLIWIFFILAAFVTGLVRLIFFGEIDIFQKMVDSTFSMSKTAFEICLGLTGVLTLWLGLMKVGENGGAVQILSRIVSPFFSKLFPEIPAGHKAYGSIMLNFAANMLGLDNAATPAGLKAMKELQELNPTPDRASNAQIMFLVLNTSGLTILPISVMAYRAELGAANPSDIFLPILLTTYFSTLAGLLAVSAYQKINLLQKPILIGLGIMTAVIAALLSWFMSMRGSELESTSQLIASLLLMSIITGFVGLAAYKKVNVYESFIEGAKEGFQIAVQIIPYLVAILVAIAVFRASGAMNLIMDGFKAAFIYFGWNTEIVNALPTAIMKPLSGSGARGMMVDTINTFGADSFSARLASTFQGATDTTFFIIAVYFGSVKIKHTRHAVQCGLIADGVGIVAAIIIATLFFG